MASRSRAFTWVNGIVALLFAISAAIQLNDPDPALWVAMYAAAAVACLAAGRFRLACLLPAAVGLGALVWALTLFPALSGFRFGDLFRTMKAETPSIELSRELLGLLIVACWMAVLLAVRRRMLPD